MSKNEHSLDLPQATLSSINDTLEKFIYLFIFIRVNNKQHKASNSDNFTGFNSDNKKNEYTTLLRLFYTKESRRTF